MLAFLIRILFSNAKGYQIYIKEFSGWGAHSVMLCVKTFFPYLFRHEDSQNKYVFKYDYYITQHSHSFQSIT